MHFGPFYRMTRSLKSAKKKSLREMQDASSRVITTARALFDKVKTESKMPYECKRREHTDTNKQTNKQIYVHKRPNSIKTPILCETQAGTKKTIPSQKQHVEVQLYSKNNDGLELTAC